MIVAGVYHEYGYEIYLVSNSGTIEKELYSAGNHQYDSTVVVNPEDGLCLDIIKDFCEYTAKEIAEKEGFKVGYIEYDYEYIKERQDYA